MKDCYQAILPVGTIFSIEGYSGFWKITKVRDDWFAPPGVTPDDAYSVVKCTKNGKEFKETNGFNARFVDVSGKVVGQTSVQIKVLRSDRAKYRRRQTWLNQKIAALQEELAEVNFRLTEIQG